MGHLKYNTVQIEFEGYLEKVLRNQAIIAGWDLIENTERENRANAENLEIFLNTLSIK